MKVFNVPNEDQYALCSLKQQMDTAYADAQAITVRYHARMDKVMKEIAGFGNQYSKSFTDDFSHIVVRD